MTISMRRVLSLVTLFVLLSAVDAFAQCKKCAVDHYTGCRECQDTVYDSYSTCEIIQNGAACRETGWCDGAAGNECPHLPCPIVRYVDLFPDNVKLQRDWQLVSVEVLPVTPATKERKRRA
jgi:hypothetical protein